MTDPRPPDLLLPSVLDRLLDEQSHGVNDGQRLEELKAAVARDLEAFLNSRRRCISPPDDLTELDHSIVDYGIEDFTGANMATPDRRERFRAAVESAIRRYEPRFAAVEVVILPDDGGRDRTLRFRIEGLLHAEPAPEPLVLDSRIDPLTCTYEIKEAADG